MIAKVHGVTGSQFAPCCPTLAATLSRPAD